MSSLSASAPNEELIPWLSLKGISTGDFSEVLQSLVGEQAKGLSANVVVRLCVSAPVLNAGKEQWTGEYDDWSGRDLSKEKSVYVWADDIHVNVRLEDDANKRQCILVLMGATADGRSSAGRLPREQAMLEGAVVCPHFVCQEL